MKDDSKKDNTLSELVGAYAFSLAAATLCFSVAQFRGCHERGYEAAERIHYELDMASGSLLGEMENGAPSPAQLIEGKK